MAVTLLSAMMVGSSPANAEAPKLSRDICHYFRGSSANTCHVAILQAAPGYPSATVTITYEGDTIVSNWNIDRCVPFGGHVTPALTTRGTVRVTGTWKSYYGKDLGAINWSKQLEVGDNGFRIEKKDWDGIWVFRMNFNYPGNYLSTQDCVQVTITD